jgi:Cu2+-exporting ATPase/Cu+-exporting ATPase
MLSEQADSGPKNNLSYCYHCDLPVESAVFSATGNKEVFCCIGCMNVHQILSDNAMLDFYQFKRENLKDSNPSKIDLKSKLSPEHYDYLDDARISDDCLVIDNMCSIARFYIEGIHCSACLWLLEKINQFNSSVISSQLNIGTNELVVKYDHENLKLSELAYLIHQLGYKPHILNIDQSGERFKKREHRKELIGIAIALVAAMNVMLNSVSQYAGADEYFGRLLSYLSLLLITPMVFYSALPFYKNSLTSLKLKKVNIDIPIALAISLGYVHGIVAIFWQTGEHYLDSIAMLCFLILISRYLLKQVQSKSFEVSKLAHYLERGSVLLIENGESKPVANSYIKAGDLIKIKPNQQIHIDGKIEAIENKTYALFNPAALNGELEPRVLKLNDEVEAGLINLDQTILIRVNAGAKQTKLSKLLDQIQFFASDKNSLASNLENYTQQFVKVLLVISCVSFGFFYFSQGLNVAIERFMALIIAACPCALGIAIPLAFSRSLFIALKNGIVIKNFTSLERVNAVDHLFLDKTGTITEAYLGYRGEELINKELTNQQADMISYAIEKKSNHPVAKSLIKNLNKKYHNMLQDYLLPHLQDFTEKANGVEAYIDGQRWQIKQIKDESEFNTVGLFRENLLIKKYFFQDSLKDKNLGAIANLKKKILNICVISGDKLSNVKRLASQVGLNAKGELSSVDKANLIDATNTQGYTTMMVGDGINDAYAMSKASVSVAVAGSLEASLRASDIYLQTGSLEKLNMLFDLARETMKLVKRNLKISLFYNISIIILALIGFITPLWAAVLMPFSSLSIIASSYFATKKLRLLGQPGELN